MIKIYFFHGLMLTFFFMNVQFLQAQSDPGPMGWASFLAGTTGGAGGDTILVTNRNELNFYANSIDTLVILIEDTIVMVPWERMDITSNKTILGMGRNAAITGGGFEVKGDNVIIRNLSIGDSYDGDWSGVTHSTDALTIYGRYVWIDHCELYASADGLLDIRADNGVPANFVTVSYTKFSNHNKVMLIGSDNSEIEDRNHLKTTLYRCWFDGTFDRGINQRMPRVRFADIHVLNNYYESIGLYCIAARFESDVVVENNYFRDSHDPHFLDDFGLGIEDPDLVAEGNIYELSFGLKQTSGTAFDPHIFYDIDVAAAEDVPALVLNGAGKFNDPDNEAPVAVDDTLKYDGTSGLKIIDATANDLDTDGGILKIARVINTPTGTVFIRDNTILYAGPSQDVGRDTIWYQLVDTQGGVDTAMVLVINSSVGISDVLQGPESSLVIQPNPAFDQVFIEAAGFRVQELQLQVFDLAGRDMTTYVRQLSVIKHDDKVECTMDVRLLPAGNYFLSIGDGIRTGVESFVISK